MSKAEMKESTSLQLGAPRFENGKALVLAGLRSRYTTETMNSIPPNGSALYLISAKSRARWDVQPTGRAGTLRMASII